MEKNKADKPKRAKKSPDRINQRKADKPKRAKTSPDRISKRKAAKLSKQNANPDRVGEKDNKKKGKRTGKKRVGFTILMVLLGIVVVSCLVVTGYVIALSYEVSEITSEDLVQAQTSFVYDQMGTEVAALHGSENRTTVDMDEMPDYLLDMVVASEDERFYEHNGVDIRGIIRAFFSNITGSSVQGASTITMQLVRNVIDEREMMLERKIKEALLAVDFEKDYDKDEILNLYVNEIYIGPEIYGMQAASKYYFNKDVADISYVRGSLVGHFDP